jgi:hypothetical protein
MISDQEAPNLPKIFVALCDGVTHQKKYRVRVLPPQQNFFVLDCLLKVPTRD